MDYAISEYTHVPQAGPSTSTVTSERVHHNFPGTWYDFDEDITSSDALLAQLLQEDMDLNFSLNGDDQTQMSPDLGQSHLREITCSDALLAHMLQEEENNSTSVIDLTSDQDEIDMALDAIESEDDDDTIHAKDLVDAVQTEDMLGQIARDEELARTILAKEDRKRKKADSKKDAANSSAIPMLAAKICEALREAPGLPKGSVVNYDVVVRWLERYKRCKCIGDPSAAGSSRRQTGCIQIQKVFHGTSSAKYRAIMENNLQVPNGQDVIHATDDGYYGCGIYTSPDFATAQAYSRDGDRAVFVCLALPGRQHVANFNTDRGRPCRTGYDSHVDPTGKELVFFHTDQLLPCFIVSGGAQHAARTALDGVITAIEEVAHTAW